ncbi:MAG: DNA gyrase subunit A [Verrucomicrobia bacterium]|jgi:DNA gyrase subunit A|nr:DNA gyrase subunit A [Verrucomicrobiota bacterium]
MDENTQIDQHIANIPIESEMSASYIDYSMSVIVGRALPDVRDGLKPVHRRVLFAMRELNNTHNSAYKKSARVVGDVIGKYHPHGDTAVYDTIVRMAQDFSMRYPLVDGQGNFGSRDGDAAAAMRYTEIRMDRMAEELLSDIDKDTVEFGPNYDESLEQPLVLPSKVPNLLLNGSTGIAVGMATNIPPHNLGELVDGLVHLIDKPYATVSDLMAFIKGPDFPTEGIICGMQPIEQMYKTGRGQIRVRGRAEIIPNEKTGKDTILISELPYMVNKARLIESMAHLVQEKTIEGISDLRDESNRKEPVRIIIELKKGVMGDVILSNLYKHTMLQTTFGANMLAIVDGQPKVLDLKEMLSEFIKHRFNVVTRRVRFDLAKAEARAHILQGLIKALENLDDVVRIIRAAKNRDEARDNLIATFQFSEIQAKAILEMRLYQLTGLEREKVEAELAALEALIAELKDLLEHDEKLYALIKDELVEIKQRYADTRRTEITAAQDDVDILDLIADEPCIITISHTGYIKRVSADTYKAQRRGGKGVAGMATREEDFVEHLFSATTHDRMLFFTRSGRVYWKMVHQIPEAGRIAGGKAIVNLLDLRDDEAIAATIPIREFDPSLFMVLATRKGVIKKTNLAKYSNVRKDGIIAINIDEDDELLEVKLTQGDDQLMLATETGMSVRFEETRLRDQGRVTRGVRGIRLREGDRLNSLDVVDPESTFLVCTENGYGKRTSFDEWRVMNRGGIGIIAIRTTERNGNVVGAQTVKESDSLMLITANGKMIRMHVSDISVIGRSTQGVRLINLDEGDSLVSAITFEAEDEIEGDAAPAESDEGGDSSPEAETQTADEIDASPATE